MQLRNCPIEFYINCKNSGNKCKGCCAGSGSPTSKLEYDPIETSDRHPYTYKLVDLLDEQSKEKKAAKRKGKKTSDTIKKALKTEVRILQRLADRAGVEFTPTAGSGRKNNDGDGKVGSIRVDHKYYTSRSSFSVSKSEWEKGKSQKINAFVVTNKDDQHKEETAVLLTEDAFVRLLSAAEGTY